MQVGRFSELQRLHLYLQLITRFKTHKVLVYVLKKSYPYRKYSRIVYIHAAFGGNNQ